MMAVLALAAVSFAAPASVPPPGDPVNPEVLKLTRELESANAQITSLKHDKELHDAEAQSTLSLVLQQRNDATSNFNNTQVILTQTQAKLNDALKKVEELSKPITPTVEKK